MSSEPTHRPNGCCDYHRHIADGCCHCENPPTAEREGLAEIAGVLGRHRFARPYGEKAAWCVCLTWSIDQTEDGLADERAYDAHVADALADLLAARDRRVRAEALREAADNWPREVNTENLSREMATNLREIPPEYRVDQWLRDRADRIEADR